MLKTYDSVPEFNKDVHFMLSDPITLDKTLFTSAGKAVKGLVTGMVTASGKYGPYDKNASDGRQTAKGILWYDVSFANGVDEQAVVMKHGRVNKTKLTGYDAAIEAQLPLIIFE